MTRIVIDLPEEDLRQLDNLKNIRNVPRAEIIRQAVSRYLTENHVEDPSNAFGLWSGAMGDGVEYENRQREEWE
ncbi:ribbon-helix-helix protein, CopG family [Serratia marcescens]|uniref:ribbon-helix-helix domain-containing protein n=1 Tax=Serratia marcescens TaxID=615 RepID=UPI00217AD61B|nr:ribbon-helix-helix domain-containing protein [Serratia marcescens]CAI1886546.1 Uncharacterised protein [Serratia marcescens]